MFQFPPSASLPYFTQIEIIGFYSYGVSPFGHVRVNALFGSSPYSFVAFSVLLRQHVPRHPPRALSRLSFLILDLYFNHLLIVLLFAYSQDL